MRRRLEGWGSTIELHPQIKKTPLDERNSVQIVGFLPTTCPDITPIYPIDDHSMPCDWARIGHEIENERHDWGMRILFTVIFYGGALVQLLRPVDHAINFPQRITGFGIMRVRIWRVIKYWLVLVAIIFALSLVFGIDLPS